MPPLTDARIRAALPGDKARKLADGGGLYLEVMPSGARYWRMKYRHAGKEKRLALGVYPDVSLAAARVARERARTLLREGTDPSIAKRAEKRAGLGLTFGALAEEWLAKQKLAPATLEKKRWLLDGHILPWLGSRVGGSITAPDLLDVLRRIERSGAIETLHRAKQTISAVFRYAIAVGAATGDPTAALRGAFEAVRTRSHAAVTAPDAIGGLLRAIDGYQGQASTVAALRLAPLVFVRPGELRTAEWSEFDGAEWRIPAEKMKMRLPHIVPLSKQALAILRELRPLTGKGRYLFPALGKPGRPLSENTLNAALRAMGFDNATMTAHGFRAMASTVLHELGFEPDVIERQLAHAERNKVRAVYNRAKYLPERRAMMQQWADHLDTLRRPGASSPSRSTR